MNKRIKDEKEFIDIYETYLYIERLKSKGYIIEATDHYEGMLISLLDYLGEISLEEEKRIITKKKNYVAVAKIKEKLLISLDKYQQEEE